MSKEDGRHEVIDLLLSDDDESHGNTAVRPTISHRKTNVRSHENNNNNIITNASNRAILKWDAKKASKAQGKATKKTCKESTNTMVKTTTSQGLQAGLVLEEDIFAAFPDTKENQTTNATDLFEDPDFGPVASSIKGMHKGSIADNNDPNESSTNASNHRKGTTSAGKKTIDAWRPKCRCSMGAVLDFKDNPQHGKRPFFRCGKPKGRKCQFFEWAFASELVPWYRFGSHNDHVLVRPRAAKMGWNRTLGSGDTVESPSIFSAQDLVQGRVGDCWFLSALAVVAERPDLVERLFRQRPGQCRHDDELNGMVRVNLFLDGIWTPIVLDNYLPCSIGGNQQEEDALQRAIEASLMPDHSTKIPALRNPYAKTKPHKRIEKYPLPASGKDPNGLSANNLRVMKAATDFLDERLFSKFRANAMSIRPVLLPTGAKAKTTDLAYSKARKNQLWVPFLEKAYAKIHGSYQAISGGHVAEAFLDLTGAPTLQIGWHATSSASASSSTMYQDPKRLWDDLKRWRSQRLPMGCGTDRSAVGLIGMHAYSILDVREITNVGVEFFKDRLLKGTLGNVSGFTEYDGILRLLRVRNPHGKGEWKGEFSDKCKNWERLIDHMNSENKDTIQNLPSRTMANDGTFWIGYDDFLLGFSNIDVVLAHPGNHAKSFVSNFPAKTSNHRCQRAFEVSLLDPQPGLETKERVEVYVMGIQKSRRGARQGRADRKKSYKVSDFGILVGEHSCETEDYAHDDHSKRPPSGSSRNRSDFSMVHGQLFGFQRNGHYKLILDRTACKRLVVMPISFGHPAATDEFRSFVVRFTADAPLMIRELPEVPRMDHVLADFLLRPKPQGHLANTKQGRKSIAWQSQTHKVIQVDCRGNGGGTIFLYLCSTADAATQTRIGSWSSLNVEATCRGMSCRVDGRLLEHETIAKGKKFEASWRRFRTDFVLNDDGKSRLLMVLFQSGQDTEMGSIKCESIHGHRLGGELQSKAKSNRTLQTYWNSRGEDGKSCANNHYKDQGVFHPVRVDNETFQKCGSYREHMEPFGRNTCLGSMDNDLEQALALSRQEQKIIHIENHNPNIALSVEEAMLQEAIQRSTQEYPSMNETSVQRSTIEETYKDDLEDALRRSLEDQGNDTANKPASNAIDLTESETLTLKSEKELPIVMPSVLDLTGVDSVQESCSVRAAIIADDERRSKTNRTDRDAERNAFSLVDSSDEEKVQGNSNNSKRLIDCGQEPRDASESSVEQSREKKRKLAAEAAMKRWRKFP